MPKEDSDYDSDTDSEVEYLFKFIVCGAAGVGKTSCIQRYVHGLFSSVYKATLGVDFALKSLVMDNGQHVTVQLWDVQGQERANSASSMYYRKSAGCICVYDVTNRQSFDDLKLWLKDIRKNSALPDGSPIPCIVLGNKTDLPHTKFLTDENWEEYAKENHILSHFDVSAKANKGIEEAMLCLVNEVLKNTLKYEGQDVEDVPEVVKLKDDDANKPMTKEDSCSC